MPGSCVPVVLLDPELRCRRIRAERVVSVLDEGEKLRPVAPVSIAAEHPVGVWDAVLELLGVNDLASGVDDRVDPVAHDQRAPGRDVYAILNPSERPSLNLKLSRVAAFHVRRHDPAELVRIVHQHPGSGVLMRPDPVSAQLTLAEREEPDFIAAIRDARAYGCRL